MGNETRTVRGRIIAVQEQSFRLLTADGSPFHLTLSVSGRPFPWDLSHYRDAETEVEVEYVGVPGTTTANAQSVRPV
jgi:hypothetical protein